MIYILGKISENTAKFIRESFSDFNLSVEFKEYIPKTTSTLISVDKEISKELVAHNIEFINWDLLFSVLGPNDQSEAVKEKLVERLKILKEVLSVSPSPEGRELHGSIRVLDLAKSAKFYTWLFGVTPKEWTHRYVTFLRKDIPFNFVLLVSDGKELHKDTLYHLGMGVDSKEDVVSFYRSALENGFEIHKPPRTTWRGTPLHELWLKDPDGTLIEIYARLSPEELKQMPNDMEPIFLV